MRKRRVVIFSAFLSPFRSGAEACAEEVALRLAKDYEITIVTARMRRNLPKYDVLSPFGSAQDDTETISVPIIRVGLGFTFDKWLYPFLAPFAARKLRPDLIHAVLETFAGLALHVCKWTIPSAKRLLTLQTTNRSFLKKFVVQSADRLTVISSALSSLACSFGRTNVQVIPNGIPLISIAQARIQTQKIPGRILFVGRMEPQKGVDTLLEAFARVSDQVPEACLRIVGDGSEKTLLVTRYSLLVESGKVKFTGRISPPKLYQEYAEAEIFCGLSRSEALGNVFIEAQAAGCAVIGTNVDGIPDTIQHEKNGLLVPPDSPEAAANALIRLLTEKELRETCVQNAIRNAGRYDWSTIAEQYIAVYDELLFRERTSSAARNSDSNVPASSHSSRKTEAVSSF